MLYSKKEKGFFHPDRHAASMPGDAKPISDGLYESIVADLNRGAQLDDDGAGNPVAVFPVAPIREDFLNQVKSEMRTIRAPMLDAVTGIGWNASEEGNAALAAEALAIRLALLDITDDPALNAATTLQEMRAAGVLAYRNIASGASASFAATFKEITGA